MPQPVRAFTDSGGQSWLVLDNGHRIMLPSGGSVSSGGGGDGGSGGGGGEDAIVVDFPAPSVSWVVDLGYLIDVVAVDSAGNSIWPGSVLYEDTRVTLSFSAAISGKVMCFR